MQVLTKTIAAAAAISALVALQPLSPASAEPAGVINQPQAGATMWFSDDYATAYYKIDKEKSALVATILPGPKGGTPVEIRRKLRFNDLESISIKGNGSNSVVATLLVKHIGVDILSRVRTESVEEAAATN